MRKRNIIDTSEIQNEKFFFDDESYSVDKFFKNHFWIIVVLILILLLGVFISIAIYSDWFSSCEKLKNPDCWLTIISFSVSYLGSVFLGIVVFYNTCQRQYIDDNEAKLKVSFSCRPFSINPLRPYDESFLKEELFKRWGGMSSGGKAKKLMYLQFKIKNYNDKFPILVDFVDAYYCDDGGKILKTDEYSFKAKLDPAAPLDYKEENVIYIGIDEAFFNKDYETVSYVFLCSNVKNEKMYYSYFVSIGKKCGGEVVIRIPPAKFEKSLSEEKQPFGYWKTYLYLGKENKKR